MTEPFFFARSVRPTLGEIIALTGAKAADGADLSIQITGAAPFDEADAGELTCFDDPQSSDAADATRAAACFVEARYESRVASCTLALVTGEPRRAFAAALAHLFPDAMQPSSIFAAAGLNPGASIHPEARLEPGVVVDPGAVIGARCEIGSGSVIAANSVIGPGVRIGRNSSIGAQVTITHALIGDRVIVHEGARIGQAGMDQAEFGLATGDTRHAPAPQVGRVILQDGVEIGANATIDRGFTRDTVIGEASRIGNLVQISPGVTVGRGCVILAQASVAAEARLGDFVAVEGQARIARRLQILRGARIGSQVAGPCAD